MYYTYMLRCTDNSIYTGIATDVERRFREHLKKDEKSAKYTRTHTALKIEAVWQSESRAAASRLEYRIKKLSKEQKEALISENKLEVIGDKLDETEYKRVEFNEMLNETD